MIPAENILAIDPISFAFLDNVGEGEDASFPYLLQDMRSGQLCQDEGKYGFVSRLSGPSCVLTWKTIRT